MKKDKFRLVLAEGPDGSGKSTLLSEISAYTGLEVRHTGGPVKSREDYFSLIKNTESLLQKYLVDRVQHISEFVYSRLRDHKWITDEEHLDVLRGLKELNPVIIYCRLRDPEDMLSRIQTKGKDGYKSKELFDSVRADYITILNGYDIIMAKLESLGFDVITYDWQNDSVEDIKKYITK